jgi:hypothetical protein
MEKQLVITVATSVSLNSDGNIVAIGAYKNDGTGGSAGKVHIYEFV